MAKLQSPWGKTGPVPLPAAKGQVHPRLSVIWTQHRLDGAVIRSYLGFRRCQQAPAQDRETVMRAITTAMAALGVLGVVTASGPARAHDNDGDWRRQEWQEHQWREQHWREHEWRERAWHADAPPSVAYVPPGLHPPADLLCPCTTSVLCGPAQRLLCPSTAAGYLSGARGLHRF
jgi:hypothetical protein